MNIQSEIDFFSDLCPVDKARFIVRLIAEVSEAEWEARDVAINAHDPLSDTLGRGLFEGLRARALTAEEGAWSFAA